MVGGLRSRLRALLAGSQARTVPSEPPLRVFVSSVMGPSERAARDIAYRVLESSLIRVWEFERTPPSPASAKTTYSDAVRHSDVVIWLVGQETTQPVRDEIKLALTLGKDLLVFRLPVGTRSVTTSELTTRVRDVAKTTDVVDEVDFERQLTQALGDLLLARFRHGLTPQRTLALEALHGRLRGIAISRWIALGVSVERAIEFFDDDTIGTLPDGLLPKHSDPFRILVGDIGSGKTLGAMRLVQSALRSARESASAPIPLWIDATSGQHSLAAVLRDATQPFGDPERIGVILAVDGLDEWAGDDRLQLVDEARALAFALPNTLVLLTARPGSIPRDASGSVSMPVLDGSDSADLINKAFDLDVSSWQVQSWVQPVQDAISRPLFALLMGRHLSSKSVGGVGSPAQLMHELVEGALGNPVPSALATDRLLMEIAARSVDAGGRPIPKRDLGDDDVVRAALRTRLLTETDGAIGFALPILREWFAARSIQAGTPSLVDLVASQSRLERWRHALYVAAGTLARGHVDDLMDAVARAWPAFASEVLEAAAAAWSVGSEEVALPPPQELGAYVRRAFDAFSDGLGPLAQVVGPRRAGDMPPMGIALSGNYVAISWPDDAWPSNGDIHEMAWPTGGGFSMDFPGWDVRQVSQASADPLWPWTRARSELRDEVSFRLKANGFYVDSPPMRAEEVWRAALVVTNSGEHSYRPLTLEEVKAGLEPLEGFDLVNVRGSLLLLQPLRTLVAEGVGEFRSPYAEPDLPRGSWVWDGFSDEALLSRTLAVYEAAFEIYESYTTTLFQRFAPNLRLAQLLPARLVGYLHPATPQSMGAGLSYFIEPLPRGSTTSIKITLNEAQVGFDEAARISQVIRRERPEVAGWLQGSVSSTHLDVYGASPAHTLAMKWLSRDLAAVYWSDRWSARW